MKLRILRLLTLTICVSAAAADGPSVGVGSSFPSPNKEFLIKLTGGGLLKAVDGFDLLEPRVGELIGHFELNPPITAVIWTKNSKSFVIVQQIAGGSIASIFARNRNGWHEYNASPTSGDVFAVIKVSTSDNTIRLKYKVGERPSDTAAGRFFVCSFSIVANNARRSEEEIKDINVREYQQLGFQ